MKGTCAHTRPAFSPRPSFSSNPTSTWGQGEADHKKKKSGNDEWQRRIPTPGKLANNNGSLLPFFLKPETSVQVLRGIP